MKVINIQIEFKANAYLGESKIQPPHPLPWNRDVTKQQISIVNHSTEIYEKNERNSGKQNGR